MNKIGKNAKSEYYMWIVAALTLAYTKHIIDFYNSMLGRID